MESKKEKFIRVAESRTNKIIDMIRLLGNCSSKSNYEYTEAEINKMFIAIDGALKECKSLFSTSTKKESVFKF